MPLPTFVSPFLPLPSRTNALNLAPQLSPNITSTLHMELKVGTRVRVNRNINMFHYPRKKNIAVDVCGFEGVIIKDVSMEDGVQMSATAPYVVLFDDHPKFRAHFDESELDVIEKS